MVRTLTHWILLAILVPLSSCLPQPETDWSQFPVHPQETGRQDVNGDLEYYVSASLKDIEAYYIESMTALGWTYEGLGEGRGGVFLVFTRESRHLEVSAFRSAEAGETRVVLRLR